MTIDSIDINICRNLIISFSKQHKRIESWKNLSEALRKLSEQLNKFSREVVDGLNKPNHDFECIYNCVTDKDNGWQSIRDSLQLSLDKINDILNDIAMDTTGDQTTWLPKKRNKFNRQGKVIKNKINEIEQDFTNDLRSPEVDPDFWNERKIYSFVENLNKLSDMINKIRVSVNKNKKDEVIFFRQNTQVFVRSIDKLFDIRIDTRIQEDENNSTQQVFDVFLSHNSKDKKTVRKIGVGLRDRGLKVWFDEWELIPGCSWLKALEQVIETTNSALVLVGEDGIGPWESIETEGFLLEFARRKLPIIPVLLPGAGEAPQLPIFLRTLTWVDMRTGVNRENLNALQRGITNQKPDIVNSQNIMY